MQFRPDVEGLRAIAILLVVAAHARVPGLDGGFVGVDVFFVLSGFLITGLLVNELQTTRRVDLPGFYARRIRRLLPALIATLAVTGVAAAVLLAPLEQHSQVRGFSAAALWLSNFHFALSDLDYFGAAAETNLVLHTWSLGVEEQFYLFWPAWLMFLLRAYAWQGGQLALPRLKRGLLATVVISLAMSIFLTYTSPRLAFYMMPARIWQFAAGAVVYIWTTDWRSSGGHLIPPWLKNAAGWCGLALVISAALSIDKQTPYPGVWAIAPTLGTSLVLAASAGSATAGVGRLLSWRLPQGIGRVSYSWYLWHWPVLVLGATLLPGDSLAARVALAAIALGIALASYHFIEAPIRRSQWWGSRPRVTLGAAGAAILAVCVGVSVWASRLPVWGQSPEQQQFTAIRSDLPEIYAFECDDWYHSAAVRQCVVGPADAVKTAVVMGDSVALQWYPALAKAFTKPGWRLVVVTKSACPMVDEPVFYARIGRRYTECETWRTEAIRLVARLRPDVVLFGSSNGYPLDDSQWREGTRRVLSTLSSTAQQVFVIRGTPALPFDGPACLSREKWRNQYLAVPSICVADRSDAPDVYSQLRRAAAGYDNVRLLDFNELVCPSGKCSAAQGNAIVFRDSQHVTASFIEGLADEVEAAIVPALTSPTRDLMEH